MTGPFSPFWTKDSRGYQKIVIRTWVLFSPYTWAAVIWLVVECFLFVFLLSFAFLTIFGTAGEGKEKRNEFLSFGFHRGERLVGPLVWLLAAKLQGKQFGALISSWWTLLGWRRRRSWGRLLEWAKKKKVHVYNQHQPPLWFLLSAIFFYFIPLQSTEAHKTRHSKGFFSF